MTSATDLSLLIEQSRLAAEASAIALGRSSAGVTEISICIRAAMLKAGFWRSDADAPLVERYAKGEVALDDLAQYFAGRA